MTHDRTETEWTPALMDELRKHWATGASGAEIGRAMGLTKNSVVGKASRMNLPPRPNPVQKAKGGGARIEATIRPDLDVLGLMPERKKRGETPGPTSSYVPPAVRAPPQALPERHVGARLCTWLEGVAKPWVPCGRPAKQSSSFCEDHHARVWRKVGEALSPND